jgi:hypothetical protein
MDLDSTGKSRNWLKQEYEKSFAVRGFRANENEKGYF